MMKIKELERVCYNCNNFFTASVDNVTEFGICLNDKSFSYRLKKKMKDIIYRQG